MEWSEGGELDNCNSIINKIYLGVVVNKCEFAVILTVHSFYLLFLR